MTPRYTSHAARYRKSPLGRLIGDVLAQRVSCTEALDQWFGPSRLGKRVLRTITHGSLVTGALDLPKPRNLRRKSARRMLAVFLMIVERMRFRGNARWQACGRNVWSGHLARRAGLAVSKGNCCREIARYLRLFAASAAMARVQPPAHKVPDALKSARNQWSAYNVYTVEELPRGVRVRITEWIKGRRVRELPRATPPKTDLAAIARAVAMVPALARLLS